VQVAGVTIHTGDILHGDRHGIVKVPAELVEDLPDAIRAHEATERRVIEVCRSPDFSLKAYAEAWTAAGGVPSVPGAAGGVPSVPGAAGGVPSLPPAPRRQDGSR
jgi:hypothetical protein